MNSASEPVPDEAFERRYLEFVARRYDRVEVLGIGVPSAQPKGGWPLRDLVMDLRAFSAAGDSMPVSVGTALAGNRRTLLRGAAGSGKTTLLWHVAVSAARGQLEGGDHLHDHLPFVLPVRSLGRGDVLPRPSEFLAATGVPIAGEQPVGWAERVLASGRALVLVDGVDEVDEAERGRIHSWLGELLTAYPDCSYVVTSRVQAVPESWLDAWEFTPLDLGPLGPEEARELITRWYAVAAAGTEGRAERLFEERRDALLAAVVERPDLRELASSPLLCSLLCFVHEQRRGLLPHSRLQLYDVVLDMMLSRRDVEREIPVPGAAAELGREEKTALLQRLAYWMHTNGRTEAERDRAVALFAGLLPALPAAAERWTPDALLVHLLERSGLLQLPAPGYLSFQHRTFQSHLAAKAAVEQGDFGLLVARAHEPAWQDVVLLACGHARRREAGELLEGLLDRAERDADHRVRLHLLAGAALGYTAEVDPSLRERIEFRVARMIPPRTPAESDALAEVGELALELMPGPENLEPDGPEAKMVVRTAQRIGGAAAHELVRRFVAARRERAARVLPAPARPAPESVRVESWSTMARRAGAGPGSLEISGSELPSGLDRLAHSVHHVVWRGARSPNAALSRLPLLRTLVIADSPALEDLDCLVGLRRLRTVRITACPALRDLTALARTGVVFLDVAPNPGLAAMAALARAERLRVLGFPLPEGEFDLEALRAGLPGVQLVPRSGVLG
ncbi:NACHT domain-containing protein [Streptomyces crystallinus]